MNQFRIVERTPTVKHLIKRVDDDFIFKRNSGFLVSDKTSSEAAYSRLVDKLEESNRYEEAKEILKSQTISEGFNTDDAVAIDATHFEAHDQAPFKEEKARNRLKCVYESQRLFSLGDKGLFRLSLLQLRR